MFNDLSKPDREERFVLSEAGWCSRLEAEGRRGSRQEGILGAGTRSGERRTRSPIEPERSGTGHCSTAQILTPIPGLIGLTWVSKFACADPSSPIGMVGV